MPFIKFWSKCCTNLKNFQLQLTIPQINEANMKHEDNVPINSSENITEILSVKSKKFINPFYK